MMVGGWLPRLRGGYSSQVLRTEGGESIMEEILEIILKILEVAKASLSLLRDIKETRRSTKK